MQDGVGDARAADSAPEVLPVSVNALELVSALWAGGAAGPWTPAPRGALGTREVRAALVRCAADAESLAGAASAAESAAARLLAETAQAVIAALGSGSGPAQVAGRSEHAGVLPSGARRRIARMEQWLSDRAASDSVAEPAANLCLWVLDCLEHDEP